MCWPRYEENPGTAFHRLSGDGVAHFSARSIANIPNRIDVLVGWPGSDQDKSAEQRPARRDQQVSGFDDVIRLSQPSLADPAAREIPRTGIHKAHATSRQRLQIALHRLMFEHV